MTQVDCELLDLHDHGFKAIHPRNGSKYSPNLYRWLTAPGYKYRSCASRVYLDNSGTRWIGMMDQGDLYGARLLNVLCLGTKAERGCWINLRGLVEMEDFWPRYIADGRCAIDVAHEMSFVGDESRWKQDGDTRDCLWCGKMRQMLVRKTVIRELHNWQPIARGELA